MLKLERLLLGRCLEMNFHIIIKLAWEPSFAQATHCYSRQLPALGRKIRF